LHIGHLKFWFINGHESLDSKASCIRCVTLCNFQGLEVRFLNFPETFGSRFRCYLWAHNLKFCVVKPLDKGTWILWKHS
jgi:hypothetical protein